MCKKFATIVLLLHSSAFTCAINLRVPGYPTKVGLTASTLATPALRRIAMSACGPKSMSPGMSAVSAASFGLFMGSLSGTSSPQGCFMSPLSIVYALSLALNGAGPHSSTHAELLRVIAGPAGQQQGLTESDLNSELARALTLLNGQCTGGLAGPSSEMYLANSLWTHKGTQLKQAYVGSMESLFQATAREATNGAKDINAWVAGATRGMIKDLIMTDDFIAVLANAIYFKGLWKHAFKSESTHTRDFTTSSGEVKQVSMMQQLFKPPGNAITGVQKKGLYDAVSLPYKGDAFSAVALLPAEGVDMSTALKDWAAGPQKFTPLRDVKLIMPKFKVATAISLKPVLQSLGVESAFSPGAADFSRMVDFGAFVSDVVHKAVVEVDEEGTVAAAATGVVMMRCLPAPPEEIIFNRPFAFMIYHNPTDLPAFIGVINDPSAA